MKKLTSHLTLMMSLFLTLFSTSSFAGKEAKVFYELMKEEVTLSILEGKIHIRNNVFEKKHFREALSDYSSTENVHLGTFSKLEHITAKVSYLNKNGKRKTSDVENIEKKSTFSGGIFYSDNTFYEIKFPNIYSDSYTELTYSTSNKEPHFLSRFFFTSHIPVKKATYSITLDKNIEIGWVIFGQEKDNVILTKSEENNTITYKWILNDAKPYVFENSSPGFLHSATHIVVHIKNYTYNGKTTPIVNDVVDLANWYKYLLGKIKPSNNDELKKLTLEITKDATSDIEKAKNIFYWVQDNIRYIAFEDGWRGFIPYPADKICKSRYGDCKDMTHLMCEMMRFVNIKANHTWIGTRKIPYNYKDVPSTTVDNHLVLTVEIDNKTYLLDATDSKTPFGVPTTFILSKTGLIAEKDDKYLYEVPSYTADYCTIIQKTIVHSDKNNLIGTSSKGFETFEFSFFHNVYSSSGSKKNEFLDEYIELAQNNCSTSNIEIKEIVPREQTVIEYNFNIPNIIKTFNGTSYINLNLTKPHKKKLIPNNRSNPYKVKYKTKNVDSVLFKLPSGKHVIELPKEQSFTNSFGSINANYKMLDGKILYIRTITIDTLLIYPSSATEWNTFIKKLTEIYNTTIEYK